MAVQSKLTSSYQARVRQFLSTRKTTFSTIALLLFLLSLLKRFASNVKKQDTKGKGRARSASASILAGVGVGSSDPPLTLAEALEKLYIPRPDLGEGSRDLLIPFRNRVSKVTVKPTKQSTYEAHYPYFKIQAPVNTNLSKEQKSRVSKGQASEEDMKVAKREEAKTLREEGGAAAASAKKVGVNKEFFRQLRAIFRILIPNPRTKEVLIFILHTFFLILRTYLSVLVARLDGAIVGDLVSANGKGFIRGLGLWYLLSIPSTYTNSMIRYLQSKLSIGFRTRLTRYVHDLYLNNKSNFYRIMNLDSRLDGADQFITTDVARFCDTLASLYSSVSKPTLDLIVFNYQLGRSLGWGGVSGLFINYMLTGWILRQVTPAFGKLAAIEAKLEGDFRSAHSRIITNAEEIAFYNGAPIEASILTRAYLRLIRHVNSILKIRIAYSMTEDFVLKYAWSAAGYVIIASPFLFGNGAKDNIPRVDDARSELGLAVPGETREQKSNRSVSGATLKEVAAKTEGYISNRRLLLSLADAGSRLMYSYKELAQLAGFTSRVYTLISTLHLLERGEYMSVPQPDDWDQSKPFYDLGSIKGKYLSSPQNDFVAFSNVPIVAPAPGMERGGEELVSDLDFTINPGDHILITGPNGVGKTAIARVLAGLWPTFQGTLEVPQERDIFFIPQRPYLSSGSLRDQVIYPWSHSQFLASGRTDEDLMEILKDVHLAYLPEREGGWDTRKEWKDVCSGGEKQRLQYARAFFHLPKFVVLDEASSAVSTDVEGSLYSRAKELGMTLITISHRPSLFKYHDVLLRLTGEDAAWELTYIGTKEEQLSFDQEIQDLESKLSEVDNWKARVQEIQGELSFSTVAA